MCKEAGEKTDKRGQCFRGWWSTVPEAMERPSKQPPASQELLDSAYQASTGGSAVEWQGNHAACAGVGDYLGREDAGKQRLPTSFSRALARKRTRKR